MRAMATIPSTDGRGGRPTGEETTVNAPTERADHTSTIPAPPGPCWIRFERGLRAVTVATLTAIVLAGSFGWLGVRTATARISSGDLSVAVEHARVARPGLAAPVVVEVATVRDTLPDTIVVEVPSSYLAIYDEHSIHPWPAREASIGSSVRWEVEVEPGRDRARVTIDARIDPAEVGRRAAVLRVEVDGHEPVTLPIRTWLVP
jgi:hypothetical protein